MSSLTPCRACIVPALMRLDIVIVDRHVVCTRYLCCENMCEYCVFTCGTPVESRRARKMRKAHSIVTCLIQSAQLPRKVLLIYFHSLSAIIN